LNNVKGCACSTYGCEEGAYMVKWRNPRDWDHLEDLGIDGGIV